MNFSGTSNKYFAKSPKAKANDSSFGFTSLEHPHSVCNPRLPESYWKILFGSGMESQSKSGKPHTQERFLSANEAFHIFSSKVDKSAKGFHPLSSRSERAKKAVNIKRESQNQSNLTSSQECALQNTWPVREESTNIQQKNMVLNYAN